MTNHQLSTGVYFYQLKAGNFVQTKKMILMK
ncbi:MAG: T9SS type A sorting domain-containing protein [Ignavibacteriales bacterium]|nr:T9SS type A sorting domain-containing protein [Ignavibacteriales bacterium]